MCTEMVKADRAGRKSVTRRANGLQQINEEPNRWHFQSIAHSILNSETRIGAWFCAESIHERIWVPCPYGEPGDCLWIRETWAVQPKFNLVKPRDLTTEIGHYLADGPKPDWCGKTRAAIHMPERYSRTTVEITGIRIERIQDITQKDAIAEGILSTVWETGSTRYKDYLTSGKEYGHPDYDYPTVTTPKESYRTLIIKLYGPKVWDENWWVWVIEYKHI